MYIVAVKSFVSSTDHKSIKSVLCSECQGGVHTSKRVKKHFHYIFQ